MGEHGMFWLLALKNETSSNKKTTNMTECSLIC